MPADGRKGCQGRAPKIYDRGNRGVSRVKITGRGKGFADTNSSDCLGTQTNIINSFMALEHLSFKLCTNDINYFEVRSMQIAFHGLKKEKYNGQKMGNLYLKALQSNHNLSGFPILKQMFLR